ncbi:MAG: CoA transferase [Chloroflexi bacterium]|nr:CoA transferase [Chloroflexota bacterium]
MLPLDGVKVVELGIWLAGPVCGVILADCGADVIKVEHLETGGDPARGWTPTDSPTKGSPNYVFEAVNRGKRALALDISHDQGLDVMYRLVKRADVFVTNLRLPTLEKLKVDYESINSVNPSIVYARGTGFGPKGPDRDKMGFDAIGFWARSGIMGGLGEPDGDPVRMRGSLGDVSTGTCLFAGVMLGLYRRQRTGQGCLVDSSLLATGAWIAAENLWAPLITGKSIPKYSRKNPPNPMLNIHCASDGRWFYMCTLQADRYWPNLCRAIDREDLIEDPRFRSLEPRKENSAALVEILDDIFATRPLAEWGSRLDAQHIAWGAVCSADEVIRDPQMSANNYLVEVEHPQYGLLKETAIPFQIDGASLMPRKASPEFGESTEEVLGELGYSWEEITSLKDQKVVI